MFILLWFLFVILCDMCVFPHIFFLFNDLDSIYSHYLCKHAIHIIITIILFLSTLLVIGGEFSEWIWAAWLLWVSRRVSIIIVIIIIIIFGLLRKFFFVNVNVVNVVIVLILNLFFCLFVYFFVFLVVIRLLFCFF